MSYIEREALREELRHCCIVAFDEKSGEPYVIDIPQLLRRTTVSADVAPVVHCKDCQHIHVLNTSEIYAMCDKTNFFFQPFGVDTREFGCPYGERRESEENK